MLEALQAARLPRSSGDRDALRRHRPRRAPARRSRRSSASATPARRCARWWPRSRSARAGRRASSSRGTPRMHERPIGDLVDALRSLGCAIDYLGSPGYPAARASARRRRALALDRPIRRARRRLEPVPDRAAARPAAACAAPAGATIEVAGELISKPYVDITLRLLERFGVDVARDGWRRFSVARRSGAASRRARFVVEGDASSASYFIAPARSPRRDAPLRIEGVGSDSIQGDIAFVDAVARDGRDDRRRAALRSRCGAAASRWRRSRSTATTSPMPR